MSFLHNRVSATELKRRLAEEPFTRTTVSFYRYLPIEDPAGFRDRLYAALDALQVFGRIYVANEGINAQVSVPAHHMEAFRHALDAFPGLEGLRLNIAVDDDGKSFWVLKIKVRPKIVADGIEDPSFSMDRRGAYLSAEEFNRLSAQPGTVVVDMRNHYEYEVGHFDGALEIPSDTFRDQLPMAAEMLAGDKDQPVIMYCTGGIRCEKASAYLLHQGFRQVFHLEGGIIQYVQQVREKGLPNKFRGKNFVFDNRMGERITDEVLAHCHQCGTPADTHVNCANDGCHLLFIQCESCASAMLGCCSPECREAVQLPAAQRKEARKGVEGPHNIFNKSRKRLRPRLPRNEG